MVAPVLFHHPSSLDHDNGQHPENATRITTLMAGLEAEDMLGFDVRSSPPASREQIEAVHSARLFTQIEQLCVAGGGSLDPDTAVSPGSWEAALRASGGAVAMVQELVGGEAGTAFSIHRPPGHHAEIDRAMGFCLFNHIAVAAQHAVSALGVERVAIVDFDVHHGNGTQEIFWERPDVHFCSVHQFPFYPGTGAAGERGGGLGAGATLNLPVASGAGDGEFLEAVADRWASAMDAFQPQLILVSAGFDAHSDDPLASCTVTDGGFAALGAAIRSVAGTTPVGVVLEGGYDAQALTRSFIGFAEALGS
ncbi:MAG TPA: histone deacetylase [Baekduia sp.]|nr:histone deacetylase [Baekduia sp.]